MKPESVSIHHWLLYNILLIIEHIVGYELFDKHLKFLRTSLYKKIKSSLSNQQRGKMKSSEDIQWTDLSHLPIENDGLWSKPILIKGGAKNWSCAYKWNEDYFAENFPDYPVKIVENIGVNESLKNCYDTDLRTFIRELKNQKNAYLRVCRILDDEPSLKSDINIESIKRLAGGLGPTDPFYLFMGNKGTNTMMHSEIPVTVFIQVKGSKKWAIYPPEEMLFLETRAMRKAYFYSDINPYKPDHDRFPMLELANGYDITTEEGDILIMPPFYWHYVQNNSDNISVSFQRVNLKVALKKSKVLTALFFLRTNPNVIQSIYLSKKRNFDVEVIMQGKKAKNKTKVNA